MDKRPFLLRVTFVCWFQKQMEDKIAELEAEKEKALSDRDRLWEQKWKERVQ